MGLDNVTKDNLAGSYTTVEGALTIDIVRSKVLVHAV